MRSYTFYLYRDDGSLLSSATLEVETDEAAQAFSQQLFRAYPACEELEIWETPRYVTQRRRKASDTLGATRKRTARTPPSAGRTQPSR